jgi:hypothetical protein
MPSFGSVPGLVLQRLGLEFQACSLGQGILLALCLDFEKEEAEAVRPAKDFSRTGTHSWWIVAVPGPSGCMDENKQFSHVSE